MSLHEKYNSTPYPQYAFPWTHPSHLGAVGRLMGIDAAPPEKCRVLEVGCARGLNLIAMAALLPESHFVGIELSEKQIAAGQALVAELGLKNVELHAADLREFSQEQGAFDYIIAHGVFSWVPEDVRLGLLALIKAHLAPEGIGYISYNVYPGWHMLDSVRDLMLFSTEGIEDPSLAIPQAIDMLKFVGGAAQQQENQAYGAFIDVYARHLLSEIERNEGRSTENIWFDEMGEYNQAYYFHEFVRLLAGAGLAYLADAKLPTMFPNEFAPEVVSRIDDYARRDPIRREQYMDFLRNRRFRESLVIHAGREPAPAIQAEALDTMVLTTYAKPADSTDAEALPRAFVTKLGRSYEPDNAATAAALLLLYHAYPIALSWPELLQSTAQILGLKALPADAVAALRMDLLRLHTTSMNLLGLHTWRPPVPGRVPEYPVALPLARLMAKQGRRVVDAWHYPSDAEALQVMLLPYVDGTRDHEALVAVMKSWLDEGLIQLAEGLDPDEALPRRLEQLLTWYLHNALLINGK